MFEGSCFSTKLKTKASWLFWGFPNVKEFFSLFAFTKGKAKKAT
jgi:hypothetical protein